jgi:hypothetical protein
VHLSIYLKQEVWLELGPKGNSSAAGESRSGVQRGKEGEVRDTYFVLALTIAISLVEDRCRRGS